VSARTQTYLWIAQRASAAILACCVAVHLATIMYAVHRGLSAAEILGRTRGNTAWLAFYCIFVLAVSVHAPVGLRAVLLEWARWRGWSRDALLLLFGFALLALGLRAAVSVFS
jgi:fumarate reductase subunit C